MSIGDLGRHADGRPSPGLAANGAAPAPSSRETEELAALYRFTDRLFRANSEEDVYEAGLVAITEAMQCDRASILRFDQDNVMRFVAWRGLSEDYRTAVDGHTPWRLGDRDASPLTVADIDETNEPESIKAAIRSEGITALAFIPLMIGGRVMGKFMTYYPARREFTADEIELGLTIARQLGFSLERMAVEASLRNERERQQLLLREMDHRIRNLFTVMIGMVALSARDARSSRGLAETLRGRIGALAKAHALTLSGGEARRREGATLHALIRSILAPFELSESKRVNLSGADVGLTDEAASAFALLLYEMATNAAKYGALSREEGRIRIRTAQRDGKLNLLWSEFGGPRPAKTEAEGFGSKLARQAAERQLGGRFSTRWRPAGLAIRLSASMKRMAPDAAREG